jgi:hypothetical protein
MIRPKVVVALYPFKAIEGGDLSLEKVSILKRANYKHLHNSTFQKKFSDFLLHFVSNIQGLC